MFLWEQNPRGRSLAFIDSEVFFAASFHFVSPCVKSGRET